ncbi:MAG TPA: TetR/AcrR family transcriptional regulator [Longimicrobiales bacterium]|nr:TetR/AcrR family transcriptional regulator [Longimicrobiales bacterium]
MASETHAPSTRDRLVHAARELFWRKGYNSTSVAEILEAVDANSGSLYHYFPTKQALLVAVLDWYADNLEPEIVDPAAERTSDPIERVFAILDGYRRALLATDLTFGCPIGNVALEIQEPDPEVREGLALNFDRWCAAVEACFGEAGDRLPEDLDRRALSRFVLTTLEGGVMQARTHRRIEPFDASVRMLRDYVSRLEEEARAGASHS